MKFLLRILLAIRATTQPKMQLRDSTSTEITRGSCKAHRLPPLQNHTTSAGMMTASSYSSPIRYTPSRRMVIIWGTRTGMDRSRSLSLA